MCKSNAFSYSCFRNGGYLAILFDPDDLLGRFLAALTLAVLSVAVQWFPGLLQGDCGHLSTAALLLQSVCPVYAR